MHLFVLVVSVIQEVLTLFLLFLIPLKNRLRFSKGQNALIICGYILLLILLSYYSERSGIYYRWRLPLSLIYILFSASLLLLCTKGRVVINLFMIFIIKSYLDTIDLTADLLNLSFAPRLETVTPLFYLGEKIAILLLTLPLICVFIRKLLKPVIDNTQNMNSWRLIWFIPFGFYIIFRLAIYPDYLSQTALLNKAFPLLQYIWIIVTFLTYFLVLHMLSETIHASLLKEKLSFASMQTTVQSEQYERLQEAIKKARQSRTDMRQLLITYETYTERGEFQRIMEDIQEKLHHMTLNRGLPICDNYIFDTIIRHYLYIAQDNQVAFTHSLTIPKELNFPENDLCIILGNLLENAVEACIRQDDQPRFINLKIKITDAQALIFVENSYSGEIRRSKKAFLSAKRDGDGIGINSIHNIVSSHNGISRFDYKDGLFRVSIMI